MRQIEFRGLRTDGKGWAYGMLAYFFDNPKNAMIMPSCYFGTRDFGEENEDGNPIIEDHIAIGGFVSVNPSTVGEFTGLHDRNGVKVFEGDNVTINGNEYFIRFNMGVFVAESVTANHLSLLPWEFNGTDITVTGNIHEPATVRE